MDSTAERGIDVAIRLAGSQSDLARMIKVSPQNVQKWFEQGKPSPKGARKIEEVFGAQCTRAMLDPYLFGPISPRK